jgi:hypothetical protein
MASTIHGSEQPFLRGVTRVKCALRPVRVETEVALVQDRAARTRRSSVTSASGGQGFGTNQLQPARVARCNSPDPSCAVKATMGM